MVEAKNKNILVSDLLIETEVVPFNKLTKSKIKELEPLVKDYIKTIEHHNNMNRFFEVAKNSKARFIIAKKGGEIIGFNYYGFSPFRGKNPVLMGSFVSEKFREMGVGSKLGRKRLYDITMEGHKSVNPGEPVSKGGRFLQQKRMRQSQEISGISKSVFEKAKKKRRR